MKVRGFTLIELIITLLIGSLLLAWGVPNYRDFKLRRMVSDNANNISYSMNLARAEAVRYGTEVEVVPDGEWHNGWTVTAIGVGTSPDIEVQKESPMDSQMRLNLLNIPDNKIVFNRIGGLVADNEARFELMHADRPAEKKEVIVTMSGNIKLINP